MQPCFFCPGLPHKLFSKLLVRIIPAYAGKRAYAIYAPACPEDHPRLRGEKHSLHTYASKLWGSSPLTRGKVYGAGGEPGRPGIIPAYAGKSMVEAYDIHP